MLVVTGHAWPGGNRALDLGWMLMDVFFVLSGFLICGILLDSRERRDYFSAFYARRAARLLPLYYVTLALMLVLQSVVVGGLTSHRWGLPLEQWGSPAWFLVYLGNMPTALSGQWPPFLFVPLWSLQLEEQFYLFLPILVRHLTRRTLVAVLVAVVAISPIVRLWCVHMWPSNALVQYVFTFCHMDGFALGALVAVWCRVGTPRLHGGALSSIVVVWWTAAVFTAVWAGVLHEATFNRTIGFLLTSIGGALLLMWFLRFRDTVWCRWMQTPVVRHLGTISYGTYLLHPVVIIGVAVVAQETGLEELRSSATVAVPVVLAVTLLLASMSWRFLERPVLALYPSSAKPDPPDVRMAA